MVAVGAHLLIAKIDLSTLRAFNNLSRYLDTAIGANGCLIAYLTSTLRTFDHCHSLSLYNNNVVDI